MVPAAAPDTLKADTGLLARLAANVVAVGRRGRETAEVGRFHAFLSATSADYFMSFAVPRPVSGALGQPRGPVRWAESIDRLTAHFVAHERALRLEFFHELHPTLATALEAAGLGLEKTASAMALVPRDFRPPRPTALAVSSLEAGRAVGVKRFLAVQSDAFGVRIDSGPTGWRPILEAGLADGTMVAAIGEIGGQACCGAVLMIGGGGAELAGVGTLPAYRRHGYAADLCGRILAEHFHRSADPVWLSADDEIAAGLYGALGFKAVGTQLNYGRRGAGTG